MNYILKQIANLRKQFTLYSPEAYTGPGQTTGMTFFGKIANAFNR